MKKYLLLLVISSSLVFSQQVKQEPKPKDVNDFRGLKFGSTVQQAKNKFSNKELKYNNAKVFDYEYLSFHDYIFNKIAIIELLFTDKKFSKAMIKFENQENDFTSALMEAYGMLAAKYGKFDEESLQNQIFTLHFPSTTIGLYYNRNDKTVNIIYENKLFTSWKDNNKEKNKI